MYQRKKQPEPSTLQEFLESAFLCSHIARIALAVAGEMAQFPEWLKLRSVLWQINTYRSTYRLWRKWAVKQQRGLTLEVLRAGRSTGNLLLKISKLNLMDCSYK